MCEGGHPDKPGRHFTDALLTALDGGQRLGRRRSKQVKGHE